MKQNERKLLFDCIVTDRQVVVRKSLMDNSFYLYQKDECLGNFRKAGGKWILFSNMTVKSYGTLTELLSAVGGNR